MYFSGRPELSDSTEDKVSIGRARSAARADLAHCNGIVPEETQ
jgi:hypothetical protein